MSTTQIELIPVSDEEPLGPMITGQHPTARLADMVPITRALLMILRRRMITQEAFCRLGEALLRDDSTYLAKFPDTIIELQAVGIVLQNGDVTIRAEKWDWEELRKRGGLSEH